MRHGIEHSESQEINHLTQQVSDITRLQFNQSWENFQQHLANKPSEKHPLSKYEKRYVTGMQMNDKVCFVDTRVKGAKDDCYKSEVDFGEMVIRSYSNYRERPAGDTDDAYTYDSDMPGTPMHFSDIVFCQIEKAVQKYGRRYGITDAKSFPLRALIGEGVENTRTVVVVDRWVKSGTSMVFSMGSTAYKEISHIEIDRKKDFTKEEVNKMKYVIRNKY
jgi:hypothetical protein